MSLLGRVIKPEAAVPQGIAAGRTEDLKQPCVLQENHPAVLNISSQESDMAVKNILILIILCYKLKF